MPSVSQAQHRFVAMQAAQGKPWAQEWLSHDRGIVNKLPSRKHVHEALKRITK